MLVALLRWANRLRKALNAVVALPLKTVSSFTSKNSTLFNSGKECHVSSLCLECLFRTTGKCFPYFH